MILRILLPFFIVVSLFAKNEDWRSNIDFKVEAGLFLANYGGDISNTSSKADFKNDLNFDSSSVSYFSIENKFNYDYIPNLYISYLSLRKKADTILDKDLKITNNTFLTGVKTSSIAEYSSINAIIYQDFMIKGTSTSIYGSKFYPGDIEFNIGLNIKKLDYKYNIQDKDDSTKPISWIRVNEFIPLPYFGFKYYRYNVIIYGDVSAISYNEAKTISAQIALDYRVAHSIYLSCGYLYEKFDVVEKDDTVVFSMSGLKLSAKYKF